MAQGLTFTTTGKAVLGPVEPGWSQQEFATPVNPNEKAGGTGVVSFTAEDVAAGVLAINKAAVSTVDGLGSVAGTVRTASKTGQRVTVTHDNKLARYNTVRNMPPMGAASLPSCLALADQIINGTGFDAGTPGYQSTGGGYWSFNGHSCGATPDGTAIEAGSRLLTYQVYDPSMASLSECSRPIYENSISATSFAVAGGEVHATNIVGDEYAPFGGQGSFSGIAFSQEKLVIMGKSIMSGTSVVFSITGQPSGPAGGDYLMPITVTINPNTSQLTIVANYRSGGVRSDSTSTTSLSSLNMAQEIAFRIYLAPRPEGSITPSNPNITVGVCNTSDYSTVVTGALNAEPDFLGGPIWYDRWSMTGNVRALWKRGELISTSNVETWPVAERQDWEYPSDFSVTSTPTLGEPSIGFNGNVWDWLQDACTAYRWEIALEGDVVTARPIGLSEMDISNYAPTPTITPTTTRTGRQVDMVYQNASIVSGGEVYDAREDDNRIISVGAAQETVTKIQTNAYSTSIVQPSRTVAVVPGAGEYAVVDSTGLPIVAGQWEDYGGALSVAIDSAEAGTIVVTLTGPREEIPSTTAPYSLAVSDGTNQYAALSIVGSGVVANPQTLSLLTGANPDITPQQVAFRVNNPFINSLEQAYDSGLWASVDAAGPRVSLDASVPTEILTGFGDTAGSLVEAFDSTYRIISAGVGRTATSLQAVRHATVGAFDDAWVAGDVSDHDAAWDGYLCEDQDVFPYLGSPAATLPPPVFPP